MPPVFFPTSIDFRRWLEANGQKEIELQVGFHKKSSGKASITYPEALDEALCFGWIDGVRNSIDAGSYRVRFSPRKPKSQWSAVNIRHVERLTKAGRMRPEGLKAFAGATKQKRKYSYEQRHHAVLAAEDDRRFRANRKAWEFFQSRPPWYRQRKEGRNPPETPEHPYCRLRERPTGQAAAKAGLGQTRGSKTDEK